MSKEKETAKKAVKNDVGFVFEKENYMIMIVGVVVIFIGFALMYGKEDIFDFRKLTLAPIVVLIGFIIEIYAIMHKPKA